MNLAEQVCWAKIIFENNKAGLSDENYCSDCDGRDRDCEGYTENCFSGIQELDEKFFSPPEEIKIKNCAEIKCAVRDILQKAPERLWKSHCLACDQEDNSCPYFLIGGYLLQ